MDGLGLLYLEGRGVAKNERDGLSWIRKSAALGHVIAKERLEKKMGK
jgi:TPR repeat protein